MALFTQEDLGLRASMVLDTLVGKVLETGQQKYLESEYPAVYSVTPPSHLPFC